MQNPEVCGTDDDYWSYEGVFRGVVEGTCQVCPLPTVALTIKSDFVIGMAWYHIGYVHATETTCAYMCALVCRPCQLTSPPPPAPSCPPCSLLQVVLCYVMQHYPAGLLESHVDCFFVWVSEILHTVDTVMRCTLSKNAG